MPVVWNCGFGETTRLMKTWLFERASCHLPSFSAFLCVLSFMHVRRYISLISTSHLLICVLGTDCLIFKRLRCKFSFTYVRVRTNANGNTSIGRKYSVPLRFLSLFACIFHDVFFALSRCSVLRNRKTGWLSFLVLVGLEMPQESSFPVSNH